MCSIYNPKNRLFTVNEENNSIVYSCGSATNDKLSYLNDDDHNDIPDNASGDFAMI